MLVVVVVQIITMKFLPLLLTVCTFAASSAFAPLATRTPGVANFRYKGQLHTPKYTEVCCVPNS